MNRLLCAGDWCRDFPPADALWLGDRSQSTLWQMAARLHGIPARLVLPVLIAAGQREPVLGPDDLRADLEATALQTLLHDRGMLAVRIDDRAGK